MGTGGKIPTPKTQPVYIVACESNSGYNLVFQEEDVFLDEAKAQAWCDQKNAAYKASSRNKTDYYSINIFNARV